MPAKKFRFVSPGVQIKEIDKSVLAAVPGAIGPVVIGRSIKGPSMVPVTVNNYEEFVQKFGEPDPGLGSSDVWRNGNNTGPTYGAYAAQAWLASSTPLTFLKLAGVADPQATAEGAAGWQTSGSLSADTGSNGGAFGLFLIPSSSANNDQTGSLGAIFYLDEGSIQLIGEDASGGSVTDGSGACVMVKSLAELRFKALIKDADDNTKESVTFNFDKDSDKFVRKVFNTNPTLVNDQLYGNKSKTYFLGETFEDFLDQLDILSANGAGAVFGFIAPLAANSKPLSKFRKEAQPAQTGWVISQHLNAETGSFDPETDSVPLFRLVAGEGLGSDWEQNNYKISIFDIKPPLNSYQKYGTFSVGIRNMADSDKSPEFVEVFGNVNLDPTSPDYIAARIGDRRIEWVVDSDGEGRYVELGSFSNNSKVVRVEMDPLVEKGAADPSALPAGFFGPVRYKTVTLQGASGSVVEANSAITASNLTPSRNTVGALAYNGIAAFTASVVYPSLPLIGSASEAGVLQETSAFFGLKVADPVDDSIKDLLKVKPSGIDSFLKGDETEYSFVFTMDDVIYDSATETANWSKGARKAGTSYTASGSNDYGDLLGLGYDKFTMPLFAGFDGLDILEREPFRNTKLANGTEKTNYALHSAKRAVLSVKDPEVLDMNLLAMPGITNDAVTNQMIRVCESRADALAIIDVEGGYVPDTENSAAETSRLGSVSETVTTMKTRNLNSSYACTYYPWVQMQDDNSGVKIWIPPSIVALGTMASSQENSEVWFAPAGFNRGGLTLGSSGLSVLNVRDKLTAKNRDSLYERGVNPIASFPSEGLVIFGQKTLQAFPSALDRINVRRLVIFLKKEISRIAANVLFEPNVEETWKRFKLPTTRLLEEVKTGFGISDYRVVLDETTTTPEEIDRNIMYAKLFIKPVYAIEFIGIDFVITNTGASFDDL